MRRMILFYAGVYLLLTLGDLGTTILAQTHGGAGEINPYAAGGEGNLAVLRFAGLNGGVGLAMLAMLAWGFARRELVPARLLKRPLQAAADLMYLNPFSAKAQPRAAMHFVALPLALLGLKSFACLNNMLVAAQVPDLVTPLVVGFAAFLPAKLAYWAVVLITLLPFWLLGNVAAAALMMRSRPATAQASRLGQ